MSVMNHASFMLKAVTVVIKGLQPEFMWITANNIVLPLLLCSYIVKIQYYIECFTDFTVLCRIAGRGNFIIRKVKDLKTGIMTGIFYGSSSRNTEKLAKEIASKLGVAVSDVFDVGKASADSVNGFDTLLFGASTWGFGDIQDDWPVFMDKLKCQDLRGKKVALFGCGDSASYPETFCDALGIMHDELVGSGCKFVGEMDAIDYPVTDSKAFADGKVLGLISDDDEPGKTEGRMSAWLEAIENS